MYSSVYMGHKLSTLQQNFVALVILRESNTPQNQRHAYFPNPRSTPMATAVAAAHLTVLLTALLRQVHIMYISVNVPVHAHVSVSVAVSVNVNVSILSFISVNILARLSANIYVCKYTICMYCMCICMCVCIVCIFIINLMNFSWGQLFEIVCFQADK